MIDIEAPALAPSEAARRAGAGGMPCWFSSPGAADLGIERQFVACDPIFTVRGSSVEDLQVAWSAARDRWRGGRGVPVAVGYLSYDLGRRWEKIRSASKPPSDWPDIGFSFYDAFWVSDAATGGAHIWAVDQRAADGLLARLEQSNGPSSGAPVELGVGNLVPVEASAWHHAAVQRILEYLRAGDVYQVNLARRLAASADNRKPLGWALAMHLARESPAPHAFWMADHEAGSAIIGNSPERFVRVDADGWIETRPIKGTRPRTLNGDAATAAALRSDPKDRAEHVMIVDLERNDLGRVCVPGSVEVLELARLVSLPTVHHLVSTVRGRLRPEVTFADLLRATFPGGSITGAPKVRAMEIIDELESVRRGPYTGATGWLGAAGDFDLAIAIRTALLRQGELTLWVGGGIVAGSDAGAEYRETVAKAEAFVRATTGARDRVRQ